MGPNTKHNRWSGKLHWTFDSCELHIHTKIFLKKPHKQIDKMLVNLIYHIVKSQVVWCTWIIFFENKLIFSMGLYNSTDIHNYLHVFVCVFVCGFSSILRILYSYRDVTITGNGLQILTYTQNSWPLSRFFSLPWLLWQGTSVYMVICTNPWHSHLLPSV